jgi:hypothetical protein
MAGRHSTITAAQREEFWRRYKAGESVLGIIGALGQRRANIHRVLEASGGIAPMPRSRSPRVLRFGEREEISRGLAAGDSFRMEMHRRRLFVGDPGNNTNRPSASTGLSGRGWGFALALPARSAGISPWCSTPLPP